MFHVILIVGFLHDATLLPLVFTIITPLTLRLNKKKQELAVRLYNINFL